jgi:hypothetical protein
MISKLGVVAAHIRTAMQMIAIEADPISVHLPVMAAEEMILSIAKQRNVFLRTDFRHYVKEEHHKEWRDATRKAYNYFKHADRDLGGYYSGPTFPKLKWLNEVQTLFNITGYHTIIGQWQAEFGTFSAWMAVKYPSLFHKDVLHPNLVKERDYLATLPDSMKAETLRLSAPPKRYTSSYTESSVAYLNNPSLSAMLSST